MDLTGSPVQMVNGLCLLGSFFCVRIVWGWYMAYDLFSNLWLNRSHISWILSSIYLFSNMSLNGLNLYWFGKMIEALSKRMSGARSKEAQVVGVEGRKHK